MMNISLPIFNFALVLYYKLYSLMCGKLLPRSVLCLLKYHSGFRPAGTETIKILCSCMFTHVWSLCFTTRMLRSSL